LRCTCRCFQGSIEEIHRPQKPEEVPGHPIHTFKLENAEIRKLVDNEIRPQLELYKNGDTAESLKKLREAFQSLGDRQALFKKRNLLFPYLEKYGITAPPKVMWGVDDEIRADIKEINNKLQRMLKIKYTFGEAEEAVNRVIEMILKKKYSFPNGFGDFNRG